MLRRREVSGFTLVAMIVIWPFTLSGADLKPQEPKAPLAHLEVASGRVDWLPEVNERLVLTVAGPEDLFLRREFQPGQMPYLNLADSKGNPMPDGSYAYELRVLQRLPEKLTKVPPVQSGFLSVQEGRFVDLSRQSKPAPKPPLLPTKDITENDDLVVQGQDGPVLTLKGDIATLLQIKFDNTDCCHPSTRDWALQANDIGSSTGDFLFRDLSAGTIPFRIGSAVPNNALTIYSNGNIGLGTLTPGNHLHVLGSAGTNKVLIEEASGTTTPREILEVRNNGGSVLIYEDTSVAQRWASGTFGANFVLDEQAHAGVEYTFTNTGNLTIAGTLTQGSSRDLKTDFTSLDPKDVLARVSALPVSLWSYKTENAVRHVGPMAEDFHQAFGLGADDKHIAPGDQAGVALLAVQGLNQLLQSKGREIATLQRENADLAKRVEALEAMLSKVMSANAVPDEQTP
jgi:hypothetical protein